MNFISVRYEMFSPSEIVIYSNGLEHGKVLNNATPYQIAEILSNISRQYEIYNVSVHAPAQFYNEIVENTQRLEAIKYAINKIEFEEI